MEKLTTTIIGLGLIGGSISLNLKAKGIATKVIGVESNEMHAAKALELGLADEIAPLADAIQQSQLIIIAVPVSDVVRLLPTILDQVDKQVVLDVGSTKAGIVQRIASHKNRKRFVATHPMWGTEFSGPTAARQDAFTGKACVICNKDESDKDAEQLVEQIYRALGMHIVYMDAQEHDVHVAYVSHISHITSFALANTVLEKEKEEDTIFELASGGFESTVRLAKSSPTTWQSIFLQNRENVLEVLTEHIAQLERFKTCLQNNDQQELEHLMIHANEIKRILK